MIQRLAAAKALSKGYGRRRNQVTCHTLSDLMSDWNMARSWEGGSR